MVKKIAGLFFFFWCLLLLPFGAVLAAGSGAYRLELPDSEAMGMGSAFVAQADNPSAIYYNPAGLTQLEGNQMSLGVGVVQPFRTYTDSSGNEIEGRRDRFVIPHFYFVSDLGLEDFAFGLGGSSYWGLGTYWAEDSFSRYVSTKADLIEKDIKLVGAYQVNDNLSIGLSLDYTNSYVNKKKKLVQAGGPDGDFQLKGRDDDGWGYRVSLLYKPNERHRFGLMYRSAIKLKYKGKLYLNGLNAFGLNYQAIFGGTSYETEITSESTLPQSIALGYCYKPNDKWLFEFDVEWMDWASTEQERIVYEDETSPLRLSVLNNGNPAPRDWEDVFSFALGGEYKLNDKWSLRGGYFYHNSPIPEENFDTSLPDSDSHSVTVGVGHRLNDHTKIDLAYAAMFFEERDINNNVGSSSGATIDGEYETFTNIYMVTVNYKF
ncbi:MAG: hypothetical protein GF375_03655 [Candidatus Omnitrophica bacterium]|nr:hypothetical protein [Candidatus Omnitrophota bacterium]MBD3269156.1 hypothetical protein [Candidatus Omnitrophota bacterium]